MFSYIIIVFRSTHVVIIAVETRVAWNVNKFCVYVVSIPHFMLSNIADTVNKHTMAMAGLMAFSFFLERSLPDYAWFLFCHFEIYFSEKYWWVKIVHCFTVMCQLSICVGSIEWYILLRFCPRQMHWWITPESNLLK